MRARSKVGVFCWQMVHNRILLSIERPLPWLVLVHCKTSQALRLIWLGRVYVTLNVLYNGFKYTPLVTKYCSFKRNPTIAGFQYHPKGTCTIFHITLHSVWVQRFENFVCWSFTLHSHPIVLSWEYYELKTVHFPTKQLIPRITMITEANNTCNIFSKMVFKDK